MSKTHLKLVRLFVFPFLLLLCTQSAKGQDTIDTKLSLITYLLELESTYDVKFSYADEDLKDIVFVKNKTDNLSTAIDRIQKSTQLNIKKISDRYYSIIKDSTVNICGFVLDNFEKNTIPGATIEILGTSKALITDLQGYFYLKEIPRKAIVQIKYLGFKPLFISADKLSDAKKCMNLAMALSYQELNEVVVYKFLTDGLAKLSDGSIELNTAEFGILPGLIEPDILQSLQALPGIKSVDETVSDINIRGGTNDQNLILFDGIKMFQSGHFFGLISAFNPYLTDNITVIKNGTSAAFGDGVSGILDMKTKNTIENSFFGGAGFNLISGDVYGQLPISENLAVQFSARRSYTDYINTPTYITFSQKVFQDSEFQTESDFYFYDFTGKVLYDINPYQRLRFSLINISNKLEYIEINEDASASNTSTLDQNNLSFGGTLESNWTDNFSSNLNLYYTQYSLTSLGTLNDGEQNLFQNNLVKESSFKFSSNYLLTEEISWLNGYQFTETGIENTTRLNQPNFISDIKGVLRSHSLFSEAKFTSKNEKIIARVGSRLNYYENINTFKKIILEPRLNVSYEIAPHIKTEILGEFKSQTINQIIDLEQNFLGIEKRRWILADESTLPITTSKQGSVGVNYDENKLYIGLEAFYKEVNGINVRTQGFQNENQFTNELGNHTVKGLEFLINKKNNYYSAWLSYTYNMNNYFFNTIDPSNFPNNLDVRHAFTLAGNYRLNNFKMGIGLNYRSGKPYTQPNAENPLSTTVVPNEIIYEPPNSSRLPEYIRVDASANYEFKIGENVKANIGASLLNVTDRKNTLNIYYRLTNENTIEEVQRVSLGITPNLSFRIWF